MEKELQDIVNKFYAELRKFEVEKEVCVKLSKYDEGYITVECSKKFKPPMVDNVAKIKLDCVSSSETQEKGIDGSN